MELQLLVQAQSSNAGPLDPLEKKDWTEINGHWVYDPLLSWQYVSISPVAWYPLSPPPVMMSTHMIASAVFPFLSSPVPSTWQVCAMLPASACKMVKPSGPVAALAGVTA